jgi:hypothetical protein
MDERPERAPFFLPVQPPSPWASARLLGRSKGPSDLLAERATPKGANGQRNSTRADKSLRPSLTFRARVVWCRVGQRKKQGEPGKRGAATGGAAPGEQLKSPRGQDGGRSRHPSSQRRHQTAEEGGRTADRVVSLVAPDMCAGEA